MDIKTLIPWSWGQKSVPVRHEASSPVDPFQRSIDELFDNFFDGFGLTPLGSLTEKIAGFSPRLDVSETEDAYEVTAELPGMNEKDVDVSVSNDILTIKGEKKQENQDKRKDYYRMECSYGAFSRSLPIPEGVDLNQVEASFNKGVLKVILPKPSDARTPRRQIPVKAA